MNETSEVKLHFLDYWRVIRMRVGLILLTFFLVMVSAGVYMAFVPKEFYSRVTIEIKPDNNRGVEAVSAGGSRADAQFIATQEQILKKSSVLHPVIERLGLVAKMSPPGNPYPLQRVTQMLISSLSVQSQRNTTLIDVGVYNTDAQLAADIANLIANEYLSLRSSDTRSAVRTTLDEMRTELDNKRAQVLELYTKASNIRQSEKILDQDPDSANVLVTPADRPLILNEEALITQNARVEQSRNKLESIEKLEPAALQEALRILGIEDPIVAVVIPALVAANAKEGELLGAGLGENHPQVKSLRAQSAVYRNQLAEQLTRIKDTEKTSLEIQIQMQKSMQNQYNDLKEKNLTEKDRTQKYIEAKSSYLQNRNLLAMLEQRYQAENFQFKLTTQPAIIRERAERGLSYERPKILTWMLVAVLVGLVMGVGLAFFVEYLDTSVKTIEDIERYLSLTVLAVIPKDIVTLIKQKRDTADAEAYRILKANIEFNQTDREANAYTLVSGGPGEGKSTTLNNLAYTFARGGSNVLVVDADLRRPSQHRFFETENEFGLADYLQGKASIQDITKSTKLNNLSFIPSGKLPQDDVGILNGPRMTELIKTVKQQYDFIFFDSPPILGVSDASLLVSEVDNTMMVVQHRRFPRGMLQRVKQAVIHVGGNLIGVVLNNVDTRQDDSYSYYSSYNEYYAPRRERVAPAKTTPVALGKNEHDSGEY